MSLQVDSTRHASPTETDEFIPQKEFLTFDIDEADLNEEELRVVRAVKEVAEKNLFHWKNFQLKLPQPPPPFEEDIPDDQRLRQRRASPRKRSFRLRDLFIVPTFDELEEVALNSHGEPKRLTYANLDSIKKCGEFEVNSIRFPGHVHRWKLSQVLQKGQENIKETLLDDLSLALSFIVIKAKGCFLSSEPVSLKNSLNGLLEGLIGVFDALIGLPALSSRDLHDKLREERAKYLAIELTAKADEEDELFDLCEFIKDASLTLEDVNLKEESVVGTKVELGSSGGEEMRIGTEVQGSPRLPYTFATPRGAEIDLRLFDRTLMAKATPILQSILETEMKGWFLHFKEQKLAEFQHRRVSDEQAEKEINTAVLDEYLNRVFTKILSNEGLKSLGNGVAELLVEHGKAVVLMCRAVDNMNNSMDKSMLEIKEKLIHSHLLLSRIKPWLEEKLVAAEKKFIMEHQWSAHEEALNLCRDSGLRQTAYFLSRDLTFMRDRQPVLLKELSCLRKPVREFNWGCKLWATKQWKVFKKVKPGQEERVPTAFSSNASPVLPTRVKIQDAYRLEREARVTNSTRYPFWRLVNFFLRVVVYTNNAIFFFGVGIPLMSSIGLRALFAAEPFIADYELNQETGLLFPKTENRTPTFTSRLLDLWRHVGRSRSQFESKPDEGFLGKTYGRHLNRFWNYFLKGILGTVCLVLCFLLFCLSVSLLSLVLAFSAPLWVPVLVCLAHLAMVLVYDWDSPLLNHGEPFEGFDQKTPAKSRFFVSESGTTVSSSKVPKKEEHLGDSRKRKVAFLLLNAIFLRIFIQGLVQPVFALVFGCLVYPTVAGMIALGACLRWALRSTWDTALFHWLIRRHGQVPSKDTWIASRIAGPGLAFVASTLPSIDPTSPEATRKLTSRTTGLVPAIDRSPGGIGTKRRGGEEMVGGQLGPFYFQIQPTQALAALEAFLLWEELVAFEEQAKKIVSTPIDHYRKFMDRCLAPFSASVSREVGVKLKELQLERDEALTTLHHLVDHRRDNIRLNLSNEIRPKVRLSKEDLAVTIIASSTLCQVWYKDKMWPRAKAVAETLKGKTTTTVSFSGGSVCRKGSFRVPGGSVADEGEEAEFWAVKGLPKGDWVGLGAHLLSEIFSEEILCYLEEEDTRFQLSMNRTSDLSRYYELVVEAEVTLKRDFSHYTEDFSPPNEEKPAIPNQQASLPIHGCKRNIQVAAPMFDVANFNPLPSVGGFAKRPTLSRRRGPTPSATLSSSTSTSPVVPNWRFSGENLAIPLPVPHPLFVALSIYNRDCNDPVSLEDSAVKVVLSRFSCRR